MVVLLTVVLPGVLSFAYFWVAQIPLAVWLAAAAALVATMLIDTTRAVERPATQPGSDTPPATPDPLTLIPATTTAASRPEPEEAPTRLPDSSGPASSSRVSEVEVRGRAENLLGIADTSNQGYVSQEQLALRPILRPAEVLETVPGLVITQHSGPGKANQYFLRGFQLDHGTDFAVTVTGVPQNLPSHAHGQGYLDLNYLIPELIDNIRYRKGPYFADVGDFSGAGSSDIQYVDTLPSGILSLEGGSFGYARALVADSFKLGRGNLLYGFEGNHEDGPWDVPDAYKRINGVVRYSEGDKDNGFRITAFGMHGEWRSTDQVAQRAITDGSIGRFGSLDPTDGGNTQRYTVVAEGYQKDAKSSSDVLAWGTWYDLDLFSDFTYFLNDPAHGDQFEQQDRRFYGGVRASHTWEAQLFGRESEDTIGIQTRTDDINNSLHNDQGRQRISLVSADDIVETTIGVYVENRTQWLKKFRTEGGLRVDYFNFHVDSNNPANSGNVNTAIFSPKLNLIFGPWYQTEFYASGGYGFHSNDGRGVTTTEVPSTLVPAQRSTPLVRAKGAEVGMRTRIVPHLQSTVSIWGLDLDSEEVFSGDTAETVPSRPSRRYGVEFANYYAPTDWLALDADFSLSRAKFRKHDAIGDVVPESIQSVLETGVTVHDLPNLKGLFGSVRLRYFGPRPLIEDDSVRSNSSAIVNAEVGYHFNEKMTLKVEFLNLFDVKTDDIQYFYASRLQGEPAAGVLDKHVHPAEPFEVRAGLVYRF